MSEGAWVFVVIMACFAAFFFVPMLHQEIRRQRQRHEEDKFVEEMKAASRSQNSSKK